MSDHAIATIWFGDEKFVRYFPPTMSWLEVENELVRREVSGEETEFNFFDRTEMTIVGCVFPNKE